MTLPALFHAGDGEAVARGPLCSDRLLRAVPGGDAGQPDDLPRRHTCHSAQRAHSLHAPGSPARDGGHFLAFRILPLAPNVTLLQEMSVWLAIGGDSPALVCAVLPITILHSRCARTQPHAELCDAQKNVRGCAVCRAAHCRQGSP